MKPQHIFAFGSILTLLAISTKNYLFKGNIRNARKTCKIRFELIIKTSQWRHGGQSGVSITKPKTHIRPLPSASTNQAIGCMAKAWSQWIVKILCLKSLLNDSVCSMKIYNFEQEIVNLGDSMLIILSARKYV